MNSSFLCVIVIEILVQGFAQKTKTNELADYMASNTLMGGDPPTSVRADKTKVYLACAEKTGVSSSSILNIKRGNWKEGDQNAKAWVQCVLMENKLMTVKSDFQLDVGFNKYLSGVERQSIEAKIDSCLPEKTMLPVEISWKFAKCFQSVDPENSLF